MNKRALSCVLLSLILLAPALVRAVPVVSIDLDNPNQVIASPSSLTTLDFTGSVSVAPKYYIAGDSLALAFNASYTGFLSANFSQAFTDFVDGGGVGTFTGVIFSVDIAAGTAADLYGFDQFTADQSSFSLFAHYIGGSHLLEQGASASQGFSILVTNGNAVPDNVPTVLLLGFSAGALFVGQRIFRAREALVRV